MPALSSKMKLALGGLLALNAVLIAWVIGVAPALEARAKGEIGRGDYALQSTDGTPFTAASLVGAPSAVFFGFTYCPDVCPTTIGEVMAWKEDLGGADELNVFFVSVDPERDTLGVLADYVHWAPGVQGVTGTVEQTDKAIESFKIYAKKVQTEDGYTMDHSASVYLFDETGRFVETIRFQEEHEIAVEKVRALLKMDATS